MIEDNAALRENTAELLELAGYETLTAKNGREGFNKTLAHRPELILCDMIMPDSGGEEFFRLVKSDVSTAKIPLIFFSAGSAPLAVKKKLQQGAEAYLHKPFATEELLGAVRECLIVAAIKKANDPGDDLGATG